MIVISALLVLVAVVVGWCLWRRGVPRRRTRVVVTAATGETFDGSVVSAGAVLRLRSVTVSTGGEPLPVDGELVLRWESVAYVQIP